MLIDRAQDQSRQREITRHFDLLAHQELDRPEENHLRFDLRFDQARDIGAERRAAMRLERLKPVVLQDQDLMAGERLLVVARQRRRRRFRAGALDQVGEIPRMGGTRRIEAPGGPKIAAGEHEAQLIGGRAQTGDEFFEGGREIEAALALGISRWKTTVNVVLYTALKGIVTGVLLALARVAGETAPLLFTAFGISFWNHNLRDPIASLPLQIFTYAISPYDDWHRQAWAGALVLVSTIFVVNVFVRILTRDRSR